MPKHVLCIDDDPEVCRHLQKILALEGFRVTTAVSTDDARKVLRADPPQLVITDMKRDGEREGLVFAEEIRRTLPGVPIVLFTGFPFDNGERRELVGNVISGCVSKTAPVDALLKEVRRLAGKPER
jgi:DNA-binding NtrC family response regulator